ncbi:hypothetical protein GYM67_01365 [Bifidobacterium asteroides]|uniref:hypothetical protein n=1 Tax=Bifidobacterium asteroides TaxID=1684 RepID=UPI001C6992CC|nr:hypothetical protein [Bifidobacterium asteroides]QYN59876.1 hypothetical protein GYM67_01365 [Bifidobacterium asteroides]
MSRGQVQVVQGDRVVARALGDIDPQLVADVRSMLGRVPAYADVVDAGRYWGTDATGTLLHIIEHAYPPPPEGLGMTTHEGRRA